MGAMVQVLDAMAEQMEALHRQQVQADTERAQLDQALGYLVESIDRLSAGGMNAETPSGLTPALERLAAGQEALAGQLQAQADDGGMHGQAEMRLRLRNMDAQLLRIAEELSAGRIETTMDLRADLERLTQAVRQLGRAGYGSRREEG